MQSARPLLTLLLCFVTALSAVGAGHARGQAQVTGHVVLCSGHGTVAVPVDAGGAPVERQVLCPDCVLSLHAPPATMADMAARPLARTRLRQCPAIAPVARLAPRGTHRARAPPVAA